MARKKILYNSESLHRGRKGIILTSQSRDISENDGVLGRVPGKVLS